ncbi:MAG: hypothetical protein U0326_24035 [Polyangiales bacterium]
MPRPQHRAGALVVAALMTSGCAQVVSATSTERQEYARHPSVRREDGASRVTVTRDGFTVRMRAERAIVCVRSDEVEGVDVVTTTRSVDPTSDRLTTWAVGALVVGSVIAAVPLYKEEARDTWAPYVIGGGALGLLGLGALVPRLVASASTGASRESRPFRVTMPVSGAAPEECATRPERAVLMFRAERRVLFERVTDDGGGLSLNLAEALPVEAFRGASPWRSLTVSSPSGALLATIELAPYRVAVADAQWERTDASPTPEALERFAADFPDDARASAAAERAPLLRRAAEALARDEERAVAWAEAGDNAARLEALSAESVGDVYEAEAECRLALRSDDLADLRANLERCQRRIDVMPTEVRARRADVFARAEGERTQARERLATLVEAERAAEARAQAAREEAARDAEARRVRAQRHAAAATRSALSRARSIVTQCRSGHASGASAARAAYEALSAARAGADGAAVRALVLQVAAACRCTPACAGVASP